ncbi:conserved hypothetical protein [Pseudogulbenkiania sp. NH8B]|uniref:DUF5906 domain-containing protein n=1 Tax=Pseudogulbenkiania sp. (strain NH8B) TaxID=748280 RepID=UPI0002279579|nr:DUF5906 domain-containing protein [Pseudogulbenkiania sp. NH8B]BAK75404.1 conserved hypothetical protein [Pseudogulbenkiania sp. NH8B]
MAATLEGVLNQFRDRDMPDIGITELRADGKKHPYGPKKKAWYRLFEYVSPKTGTVWVSGVFGHKDEHWKVEREELANTMTPEEREAARAEWARQQREQEARQARTYAMAANRAKDQWSKAVRSGESPYLARKQVAKPESVRFMAEPGWENWLIIPLIRYDEGRMVGVQKIAPAKLDDGSDKRFNKGFEKPGSACRLGDEPMDGDLILLAEGYATAASGREGVGYEHPVYMALDSGNLLPVARILRAKYPSSPMLFLADDDYMPTRKGDENHAGEKKARQVVQEVGNAALVLPRFTVARRAIDVDESLPKLTDFNDLHCAEGIDAVREQIRAAISALLSPAPTQGDDVAAAPDGATATHTGGAGVDADKEKLGAMMAEQLFRHFALVEGKTRVIDKRFGTEYTLPSLRAKFGKKAVDAWLENPDKLLITQAEVSAAKKAREEAEKKDDTQFLEMMKRYVYLDGSTTIWDAQLQEMIPQGAAKLAMGSHFDVWVDSPERKVVPLSNVRFAPGAELPADKYINLFSGMEMKPWFPAPQETLPRKLWELVPLFKPCENIIALAYHLCDARNDVFEWLLNWIAYPLQHVGAKMDTAVLVHGSVHGSGKSMFFERCVKPLYGRYSITLGQDQLESQYTGSRSARLFLLFEEVISSKQRYSQTGKVKHMITGLTQVIEKKFMNAWEEANCANCVFLSNAIQPIHVEAYDRRFQVIWPIETAMEEIYSAVDREISEGGLEAFLGLLKALPLTLTEGLAEPVKFDPHTKPLMTEEKKRLIRYGLSGWELFVFVWEAGEIGGIPFVSCLTEDLYAVYRKWCDEYGETSTISFNKFSLNVSVYDMRKLTKKVAWWRWSGMPKPAQNTVFKVGREDSGVAEQDYLGKHISLFKQAAREYGVTLRGDL